MFKGHQLAERRGQAVVVRAVARAHRGLALLQRGGEVEVRLAALGEAVGVVPEGAVQATLRSSSAGSTQVESMLSIHSELRSPKAVSSAATRPIAPPQRRITMSDRSEGRRSDQSTVAPTAGAERSSR